MSVNMGLSKLLSLFESTGSHVFAAMEVFQLTLHFLIKSLWFGQLLTKTFSQWEELRKIKQYTITRQEIRFCFHYNNNFKFDKYYDIFFLLNCLLCSYTQTHNKFYFYVLYLPKYLTISLSFIIDTRESEQE